MTVEIIKRKKNKSSTIQTRNMGSLRRMVQYYGSGNVPMKRTLKKVHGVTPTLSISKAALFTFADMIGQFQVAVTKNANGRPSKQANASLTAGDIEDGFRSLSSQFFHHIENNKAPSNTLLMGKSVYPLPLKRTSDIIKSVVRNRRVTKRAITVLNEYAVNVALHMITVAGRQASQMNHSRISLDDFKTTYSLNTFGLHKMRLEEMSRKKKKSPTSYLVKKIYEGSTEAESEYPKDLDMSEESEEDVDDRDEVHSDENNDIDGEVTEDEA
ncbi:MAG: hypothetical protein EOP45_17915 [Sphingobacteriaceae bacterium]|nr:MAG: hypothetical protein EOP45_17915 [Sphingobacteriaceae bacterium]